MRKAFHIKTRKPLPEDKGVSNIDKIGGLPTHKPLEFPKYYEDEEYGFVMQIYCDKEKFPGFEGVLCWHIYQPVDEDDEPILVEVPIGAELNVNNEGTPIERLGERIIYYEEGMEPDILIANSEEVRPEEVLYYNSRIGGAIPEVYVNYDKEFIGWIVEHVCHEYDLDDLNFGATINLLKNKEGKLEIELGG